MSELDTLIRGAGVIVPEGPKRIDVGLSDGRIVALGAGLSHSAATVIEAQDAWLVPGMIDAHVHFNEPGRTDWEGFATGSAAAAAGGVTTVFDMPLNSSPPTVTPAAFIAKRALAEAKSAVKVRLWGGLVPGSLDQLYALHSCGVVGFKAFMSSSGVDEFPRADAKTLKAGMKIIARLPGMRLAVHAEDEAMTVRLADRARAAGRSDAMAFVESRPIAAEVAAIREVVDLAGETGCRLHLVHVSSSEGVEAIAAARVRGVNVTVETCPHYLTLTTDDLDTLGVLAKCAPPLRSSEDQKRLWDRVLDGKVDIIASDHSPCPDSLKSSYDFFEAWGGISGVQHSLPLLYTEGAVRSLAPERIAQLLSSGPADIFGLGPTAGRIAVGAEADLCLLARADEDDRITADELMDRHRHSPYVGRPLLWKVKQTWVNGRTVFPFKR